MIFYRLWNNFEDLWILWQLTTYRTLLLTLEHFLQTIEHCYWLRNTFTDYWTLLLTLKHFYGPRTLLPAVQEHFYLHTKNTFSDFGTLLLTMEHFYRLWNNFTDQEHFYRPRTLLPTLEHFYGPRTLLLTLEHFYRPRTLLLTMEHFYWLWNTFTDFGTLSLTVEHFANQIFISLCQPLQKRTCVVRVHHR